MEQYTSWLGVAKYGGIFLKVLSVQKVRVRRENRACPSLRNWREVDHISLAHDQMQSPLYPTERPHLPAMIYRYT